MARGAPDFSNVKSAGVTSRFLDLGELATRLGSPASFYRDGEVMWMDDFSHGLERWSTDPSGTGASIAVTPDKAIHGGYCAKLVTGDEEDDYAEILTILPYPYLAKTGVEFSFTSNVDLAQVQLLVSLYDGTDYHNPVVRFSPTDLTLIIRTGEATWQTIATSVRLYASDYLFHTLKLVFDPTTGKYTRLHVNANSYDVSSYSYYKTTGTVWKYLLPQIRITTSKDDNETSYIDRVIVTSYPS